MLDTVSAATPHYVFHHIPRCGGTSCMAALSQWFHIVRDYRKDFDSVQGPKIDLASLTPNDLLCGHFSDSGEAATARYPEAFNSDRFRTFTFVREPLDLAISLRFYGRRFGAKYSMGDDAWADILSRPPNYMGRMLSCLSVDDVYPTLNRYWFVGLTGRLQDSFDRLADRIGRPRISMTRINTSERPYLTLTTEQIEEFQFKNSIDYAIFNAVTLRYQYSSTDQPVLRSGL